jgi:uncharacterized protein YlxW (UPF0749 family)
MEILKSLLCGAVGAAIVAGLFSLLGKKVDHSHEDKKEKMAENKELQKRVQELADAVASINERIDKLHDDDRALMKAVNALLLHNMTGNATGKMAKAQDELTTYIIEHGGE